MDPEYLEGIAGVITAVSWPIISGIVIIVFRKNPTDLFQRTNSVELKALGHKIILSTETVNHTVEELWKEIVQMTDGLTEVEKRIFHRIDTSDARRTVKELFPDFERSEKNNKNTIHPVLRQLRDRMLIRPVEENSWRDDKRPIVTRFGRLALQLNSDLLKRQAGTAR